MKEEPNIPLTKTCQALQRSGVGHALRSSVCSLLLAVIASPLCAEAPARTVDQIMDGLQQIASSLEKARDADSMASAINALEKALREIDAYEGQSNLGATACSVALRTNLVAAVKYSQGFSDSPTVSIALARLRVAIEEVDSPEALSRRTERVIATQSPEVRAMNAAQNLASVAASASMFDATITNASVDAWVTALSNGITPTNKNGHAVRFQVDGLSGTNYLRYLAISNGNLVYRP